MRFCSQPSSLDGRQYDSPSKARPSRHEYETSDFPPVRLESPPHEKTGIVR